MPSGMWCLRSFPEEPFITKGGKQAPHARKQQSMAEVKSKEQSFHHHPHHSMARAAATNTQADDQTATNRFAAAYREESGECASREVHADPSEAAREGKG